MAHPLQLNKTAGRKQIFLRTCKKAPATDCRACVGHGSNQSMTQLFTRAGKFLHLRRRSSPTGDMANTMCRFFLQRSVKAFHMASLVTSPPCEATCMHWSFFLLKTVSFKENGADLRQQHGYTLLLRADGRKTRLFVQKIVHWFSQTTPHWHMEMLTLHSSVCLSHCKMNTASILDYSTYVLLTIRIIALKAGTSFDHADA